MKLPKGLSYRRSLETSLGFFSQTNASDETTPIILERKTLVGPFSDIASASGTNQKNTNALNIFRADLATLASDTCEFSIECSLTILQHWKKPYRCENHEVAGILTAFTDAYYATDEFKTLSEGYAENILGLTWCWRNSETFTKGRQSILRFNDETHTYTLPDDVTFPSLKDIKQCNSQASVEAVITFIQRALTDQSVKNQITMKAVFPTMPGMEVYPSQEFVDENNKSSDNKSARVRELSCAWTPNGKRQAAYHKTKISNALHKVDRWYENSLDAPPINVNPLGYEQQENKPYRSWKSGLDIYHIFMDIEDITDDLVQTKIPSPHSHFLAANITRGGLFTAKKETGAEK
ncbi:hypothetical protein EOPP23_14920 [Endozoicomonas sp. OPT23]|uniref:type I-F CRISPR-associated protein Cas7f/Csy3 n=1 Tax=Endozoicomonas sp. OPT23 TaxID=2072845 RepID=UPI00129B4461|nr:type I-F CRISPR-associated protein Cas7f/Csy3 [Endozoicomonas sp. OPT23]MRI34280.1 hypothetical protein [Endozoicomonas sp. OPT23]